jgi:hypothetical protein
LKRSLFFLYTYAVVDMIVFSLTYHHTCNLSFSCNSIAFTDIYLTAYYFLIWICHYLTYQILCWCLGIYSFLLQKSNSVINIYVNKSLYTFVTLVCRMNA